MLLIEDNVRLRVYGMFYYVCYYEYFFLFGEDCCVSNKNLLENNVSVLSGILGVRCVNFILFFFMLNRRDCLYFILFDFLFFDDLICLDFFSIYNLRYDFFC